MAALVPLSEAAPLTAAPLTARRPGRPGRWASAAVPVAGGRGDEVPVDGPKALARARAASAALARWARWAALA